MEGNEKNYFWKPERQIFGWRVKEVIKNFFCLKLLKPFYLRLVKKILTFI